MSRSKKKVPFLKGCASQKEWKQEYNRNLRRKIRVLLKTGVSEHVPVRGEEQPKYDEHCFCIDCNFLKNDYGYWSLVWPDIWDVSNIWTSPSDGGYSFWDYWSERQKKSLWRFYLTLPIERRIELENEERLRKERLKWRVFMK